MPYPSCYFEIILSKEGGGGWKVFSIITHTHIDNGYKMFINEIKYERAEKKGYVYFKAS